MRERIEYDNDTGGVIVSWLRYEYEGLNLLRIDQLYDGNSSGTIDSTDYTNKYWRPMNIYLHGPGAISQIIKSKWFSYEDDSTATPCTTGEYYYFYDAVGNVVGVWDQRDDAYHSWAMDAFGNPLSGVEFLAMDQPGPKEHLTGKMFDTVTGLYYFHARWLDPEVGRFVSRDPFLVSEMDGHQAYVFVQGNPLSYTDPSGKFWIPFITCGYFLATHGAWAAGCIAGGGADFDIFMECYGGLIRDHPILAISGGLGGAVCISSLIGKVLCDAHCELQWHTPHDGKGCHIHLRCWQGRGHHEDLFKEGIPTGDFCPPDGYDQNIPLF